MTTKMNLNLNGTTRKALVAAIAEITGEKAIYRAMPTCNYDIGDIPPCWSTGTTAADSMWYGESMRSGRW